MPFSYFVFIHHPIHLLAFIALILSFISLWIYKTPWLWGLFLLLALPFALLGNLIDVRGLVALGLLCGIHLLLTFTNIRGAPRLIAILAVLSISFAMTIHICPGFYVWKLGSKMQISSDGYPYLLLSHFDTPFTGLFPLALSIPLIHARMYMRSTIVTTVIITMLGIIVMMILALYLHFIKYDPKFPHISVAWLIINFFLVSLPQEAFFRGFVQKELSGYINIRGGGVISVCITALIFGLLHLNFIYSLTYLLCTFIAGLIYGSLYHTTRSIESSIFCHYTFNAIHFFFFTYPALVH